MRMGLAVIRPIWDVLKDVDLWLEKLEITIKTGFQQT